MDALHSLMLVRMEDEAFVLATTAAAARLLTQPSSRAALLAHPEVAARFAELLQHSMREVGRGQGGGGCTGVPQGLPPWARLVVASLPA